MTDDPLPVRAGVRGREDEGRIPFMTGAGAAPRCAPSARRSARARAAARQGASACGTAGASCYERGATALAARWLLAQGSKCVVVGIECRRRGGRTDRWMSRKLLLAAALDRAASEGRGVSSCAVAGADDGSYRRWNGAGGADAGAIGSRRCWRARVRLSLATRVAWRRGRRGRPFPPACARGSAREGRLAVEARAARDGAGRAMTHGDRCAWRDSVTVRVVPSCRAFSAEVVSLSFQQCAAARRADRSGAGARIAAITLRIRASVKPRRERRCDQCWGWVRWQPERR